VTPAHAEVAHVFRDSILASNEMVESVSNAIAKLQWAHIRTLGKRAYCQLEHSVTAGQMLERG
jgi:hypothetical protein